MRILVTGGTGFIGKNLMKEMNKLPYDVFSFSSKEYDLTFRNETFKLFDKVNPDVIIHLAAKLDGIGLLKKKPYEYLVDNLKISMNVVEASLKYKVSKIIAFGTTCSYPLNVEVPTKEEHLFSGKPENTYGLAKLVLLELLESSSLNYLYIIPGNVYGPYDHFDIEKSHVIPATILKFYHAIKEKKENVTMWGDGEQVRDFIFVEDLVNIVIKLLNIEKWKYRIIHVSSGVPTSIKDLAYKIRDIMNANHIKIFWDITKPQGIKEKLLDISKLREVIGNYEFTSIENGLKITVDYFYKSVSD